VWRYFIVPRLQTLYISGRSEERKQEKLAFSRVRGVLCLTHLLIKVFGQHRLHKFGQVQGVRCDLPRNTPPFRRYYGELHHADISLLLNKNGGSQFSHVQHSGGAWHLLNSVRQHSEHASFFTNYKVALTKSLLLHYILS